MSFHARFSFSLLLLSPFCLNKLQAQQVKTTPYTFNRLPLKQSVYAQLPLGSIKAKGWLLKQLELQRDGFTGHAEELYPGNNDLGANSDWLGGSGAGWERVPYYLKGLVALAYTLDDATLKTKAQKWLDYTLDHQQDNGLFGPVKMKDWWPRMPFMYALQSYYEATQDKRVIPLLSKYFKYELDNLDKDPLRDWGKSRAGDNMEIAIWVYNKTGEKFLLNLVEKLKDQAYPWADIFNNNKFFYYGDDYQPKHMVNVSEALKFPALYSQVTPTPYYLDAMQNGIDHIEREAGQPTGIGSGTEHMSGNSSVEGVETCAVVEWMQSLETAARVEHDAKVGDQLEKIAFNTLPAQFDRDLKNHTYYTLPNQVQDLPGGHGFNQDYSSSIVLSPYSGFPCCRYNLHMGWPYFVKNSWLATPDGGLAVSAYAPMEINATVADNVPVKIEEITNYPFDEQINLVVTLAKPVSFPLRLRIPSWCKTPVVKVNGQNIADVQAGQILNFNRKWKNADKVTLNFPMSVNLQQEVNNGVSVERGPLVYALKIKQIEKDTKDFLVKGFHETQIAAGTPWNYGLVLDNQSIAKDIAVVKTAMPENPFIQLQTPVQLKVKAKKIPSWTLDYYNTAAMDVPYSPVASAEKTEEVLLVPYGSENIRLSIFPIIGKPDFIKTDYKQSFDNGDTKGMVIYGGGWFVKDKAIHCASNGNNSSGNHGPKIIATNTNFSNFVYSADVALNSPGDAGMLFRVSKPVVGANAYQGYYAGLNVTNGTIEFGKASGSEWVVIQSAKLPVKMNASYNVKVKAVGDSFEIYVNNATTPIISAKDNEFENGSIGLRAYNALATMDNLEIKAVN